ncbi:MAG: adenine phosphoribosyltransferase [Candidatus Aminicenantes bacterium]|nr:adenine phosphoribosyltransferase [Candidatus Aminicenantes bacterium]
MEELKKKIREVPDFPKAGILFYDVTTLLKDADGLRQAVDLMVDPYVGAGIDKVVGIESRGFILAPAMAIRLDAGFVLVRKPGKLPAKTIEVAYDLEYGQDRIEVHEDAIEAGERVLIVDDLMATGGTAAAAVELVRRLEGNLVGAAFLVELEFLQGRAKVPGVEIFSLLKY